LQPPPQAQPKPLERFGEVLRSRLSSRRTEQTYCNWLTRFTFFHQACHLAEMGEQEIKAFLTRLATVERVSSSTQNQALSALPFLYRHVLGREVGGLGRVIRARKPTRLPSVLTRDEARAVLANLTRAKRLRPSRIYSAGLRFTECPRLRVQDIDFARNEITVAGRKGAKDRVTMLPESLKAPLENHLRKVKAIHEKDLRDGWGGASRCPTPSPRKYPIAPPSRDWRCQLYVGNRMFRRQKGTYS
jgi:site-specific recombinase XerD